MGLAKPLKLSDCQRGVVFDGIETSFLTSIPVALQTVLKALNNRKYIYVLNTKFTHEQYEIRLQRQELEKVQQEEKAKLGKFGHFWVYKTIFCDSEYEAKMKEMSEEEYDNLDEEERKRIDSIRLDKRYVINFIT